MPEPYYGTWQHLGKSFGEGLAKGYTEDIAAERALERQIKGFRKLAPLRAEQREEEFAYETKRGRSAAALKEEELAREETALSEILGPILEQYMPPSMPTPERGEAELPSPYKAPARLPKAAVSPLLSFLKPPKATSTTGRAPTHTEMQVALTNPGHPMHEQAKRYFYGETGTPDAPGAGGYVDIQRQVAGERARGPLEVRPQYPAEPTSAQMGDLQTADVLLQQLDALEAGYEKNKHLLGGLLAGGGRAKRYGRQLFDLLDPSENEWIALSEQLRGGQILDFFGKVVPKGETELAARMIPDVNVMQPNQFKAAIQATRDRIIKGQSTLKQQLRTPRGAIGSERNTIRYNAQGQRLP